MKHLEIVLANKEKIMLTTDEKAEGERLGYYYPATNTISFPEKVKEGWCTRNPFNNFFGNDVTEKFSRQTTALESFLSLLQHHTSSAWPLKENSYGKTKEDAIKLLAISESDDGSWGGIINLWQQAESKVMPSTLLCFLIK